MEYKTLKEHRSSPSSTLPYHTMIRTGFVVITMIMSLIGSLEIAVAAPFCDSAGCRDSVEEMYAVDYYPLHTGNSWTYLIDGVTSDTDTVLSGTVNVNGIATKRIQTSSDGSLVFYTNDVNGLRLHKAVLDGDSVTFIPPARSLHPEINIGDVITSSGTASFYLPGYGTYPLNYTATISVLVAETVTVPLGTYPAIKIQYSTTITGTIEGVLSMTPLLVLSGL